jgi:hypothetical protein
MSNLSTFAEVGIVDARASAGTLVLPRSADIPGRVIMYKDIYGAVGNSTIALLCSTNDTFEDGTNYRTLNTPYDFITLYAASTNMWAIIGGTQVTGGIRAPIMSNTSNYTSSIVANTVNTGYTYTSFLYPQVGLSNIITSNLVPPANATTTGAQIGLLTSNYWQIYSQSTITSNIGASFSATSTIFANASLTPAFSTSRISTMTLGTNTNRWFQTFAVSTITSSITTDLANIQTISTQNITGFNLLGTTILSTQQLFCSSLQIGATDSILDIIGPIRALDMSTLTLEASTITSGTMTLDKLFGGTLITNATTTNNLYPFSAGALVGFGSNTSQGGTYAEGHFRSTFTSVIQPFSDSGSNFSNVVLINGITSTQSIYSSTISTSVLTVGTIYGFGGGIFSANLYPLGTNILGYGTGGPGAGPWDSASIRLTYTSSIVTNNISTANIFVSTLSSIYLAANSISSAFANISSLNTTNFTSSNFTTSSFTANYFSAGTAYFSTFSLNNISTAQGTVSSLNVNALTFGAGNGYVNIPFVQSILVSSIQMNTSVLNTSSITGNTLNLTTANISTAVISTLNANTISTGALLISSFNTNSLSAGTLIFSSLNFQNISIGTGFVSSLNVNSLTFGTGTGYAAFAAIQAGIVSSIQADTGAQKVSSLNLKMPPFWSTLNIPASSFTISGTSATTPQVLYSNVQFPPYTKGLYKIYQKAILVKSAGATSLDVHPSILYTQGLYPSTLGFLDGYSHAAYVNQTNVSTYTTLVTTCQISSITTRTISYFDQSSNAYTASLFLGNLAVEYVPPLGIGGDFGNYPAGIP